MSGLDRLKGNLGGWFGTGRRRSPKTRKVAVYPNGRRYILHFSNGAWWWDHGKGSYPQSVARWNVEQAGGRIVVENVEDGRP